MPEAPRPHLYRSCQNMILNLPDWDSCHAIKIWCEGWQYFIIPEMGSRLIPPNVTTGRFSICPILLTYHKCIKSHSISMF